VADNPPAAAAMGRARETKQALVLGLLQRKKGASLAELVAATGWLPHTKTLCPWSEVRAFRRSGGRIKWKQRMAFNRVEAA
jgi:hypothetical protein